MQRTERVTDLGLRLKTDEKISGYGLIKRRGRGGYAEVWEADSPGGYRVALKLVPLSTDLRSGELRALMITRGIRHPSLLEIYGTWQVDNLLIICMELADRSLWDRFIEADAQGLRGVPRAELLGYLDSVAEAIDYLNDYTHSVAGRDGVGVQHRDVKPQNILLFGGRAKVGDFGLARVMEQAMASHTGHCTLPYAAPENFGGKTSRQSDQYALAVTYCQLRGGWMPFQGSLAQITFGHLYNQPDLSGLPAPERPIVARALAKRPEDRWPDCRSFVEALRNLGGDETSPVPDLLHRGEFDPASELEAASRSPVPSDTNLNSFDSDFIPLDTSTETMAVPTHPASLLPWDTAVPDEGSSDFIPIDNSGEFGSVSFEHRLPNPSWDSELDDSESCDFIPIDTSGEIRALQPGLGWPDFADEPAGEEAAGSVLAPQVKPKLAQWIGKHAGPVNERLARLHPKLAAAAGHAAAFSAVRTKQLTHGIRTLADRGRRDAARLNAYLRPRLAQIRGQSLALAARALSQSSSSARHLGRRLGTDAARLNAELRPRLARATSRAASLTRSGTSHLVRSARSTATRLRSSEAATDAAAWMRQRLASPSRADHVAALMTLGLVSLLGGVWMLGPRSRPAVPSRDAAASRPAPVRPQSRVEPPAARALASVALPPKVTAPKVGNSSREHAPASTDPARPPAPARRTANTKASSETAEKSAAQPPAPRLAGVGVVRGNQPDTAAASPPSTKPVPASSPAPAAASARVGSSEPPDLIGPLSMAIASGNSLSSGPAAAAAAVQPTNATRAAEAALPAVRDGAPSNDEPPLDRSPARAESQPGQDAPAVSLPTSVSVTAGETTRLPVRVARNDPVSPTRLEFQGLPRGVSAEDRTIPAGKTEAEVALAASPEAAAGTAEIKVGFTAGAERGEAESELTVKKPWAAQAFKRGQTNLEHGANDLAIADFDEALRLDPDSLDARLKRGVAYNRQGRLREALADLNAALRASPDSAEAHLLRGQVHRALGQHRPALEDYNAVIRLHPEAKAYLARGSLLHEIGDYDQALADYDRAVRLDPNDYSVHYQRGVTRYIMGDNAGAIRDLTEAIRHDPRNIDAYQYRSHAFARQGEYSKAGSDHDTYVRLNKPAEPGAEK